MPRRKKTPPAEPAPEPAPERAEPEVDREIAEDFQERQNMSVEGSEQLARQLREHNALSPELSAGDVDAAWELARESGEETLAGHAPTPDQDRVDDLGAAAGLTYKDDEPLQYDKVSRRDDRRWELDARSGQAEQAMAEDDDEDDEDEDDTADADDAPLRFWDLADDLDAEVEEELDDADEDEDEEDDEDDEIVAAVDEDLEADELDADDEEDELETDDIEAELDEDLDDFEDDDFDDEDDDD